MAEKYGMPGKTDNEGWSPHVFIAVFWPSDNVLILRILEYLWGCVNFLYHPGYLLGQVANASKSWQV